MERKLTQYSLMWQQGKQETLSRPWLHTRNTYPCFPLQGTRSRRVS